MKINISASIEFVHQPRLRLIIEKNRKRKITNMAGEQVVYRVEDDDQFDLALEGVSRGGNVVPLTGVNPNWVTSDPSVLTVTDNGAGGVTIATTGKLGVAQISVTLDPNPNDDVDQTITGLLDVEVVAGGAAAVRLTPTNLRDRENV